VLGVTRNGPMFSIKSNSSNRELRFLEPRRDLFTVQIHGSGVTARREVSAYTDARGIARLFSKLAACERPWTGVESWTSLEGEFSLSATCSALGHVTLSILISDAFGGDEEWRLSVSLVTELGQLPKIAADARAFFDIVGSSERA
jgi:hypothetical protein